MTSYTLQNVADTEQTSAFVGFTPPGLSVLNTSTQRVFQTATVQATDELDEQMPVGVATNAHSMWASAGESKKFSSLIPRHGEHVASPRYLPPVLMYAPKDSSVSFPKTAAAAITKQVMFTPTVPGMTRRKLPFLQDATLMLGMLTTSLSAPNQVLVNEMIEVVTILLDSARVGGNFTSNTLSIPASVNTWTSTATVGVGNQYKFISLAAGDPTPVFDYSTVTGAVLIITQGDFTMPARNKLPVSSVLVVIMCNGTLTPYDNAGSPQTLDTADNWFVRANNYNTGFSATNIVTSPNMFFDLAGNVSIPATTYVSNGLPLPLFSGEVTFLSGFSQVDLDGMGFVDTAVAVFPPNAVWFEMTSYDGTNSATILWDIVLVVMKRQYDLFSATINADKTIIESQIIDANGPKCQTFMILQPNADEPNWMVDTAPFVFERYMSHNLTAPAVSGPMIETYRVSSTPPIFTPIKRDGYYMTFVLSGSQGPVPLTGGDEMPFAVGLSSTMHTPTTGSLNIEPTPGATSVNIMNAGDCVYGTEDLNPNTLYLAGEFGADQPPSDIPAGPTGSYESLFRLFDINALIDNDTVMLRSPYLTHIPYRPLGMRLIPSSAPAGTVSQNGLILIRSKDPLRSNVVDISVGYASMAHYSHPEVNMAKFFDADPIIPVVVFADTNGADVIVNGTSETWAAGTVHTVIGVNYTFKKASPNMILAECDVAGVVDPLTTPLWQVAFASIMGNTTTTTVRVRVTFGDMIGPQTDTTASAEIPWVNYYKRTTTGVEVHIPDVIDHDVMTVDGTYRAPGDQDLIKSSGFGPFSADGSSKRFEYQPRASLNNNVTVVGVELLMVGADGKYCTNIFPGTVVAGPSGPVTIDQDGKVGAADLPFTIGNRVFKADPTPCNPTEPTGTPVTVAYNAPLPIDTTSYTDMQKTALKQAGFVEDLPNMFHEGLRNMSAVYAKNIVIEGRREIKIKQKNGTTIAADELVSVGIPDVTLRKIITPGTVVTDSAGMVNAALLPLRFGDVVFVAMTSELLRVTPDMSPLSIVGFEKDRVETLRRAGFKITTGTATRVRQNIRPVYGDDVVVVGLHNVESYKKGDKRVRVPLQSGTVTTGGTVDSKNTLPISAFPLTHRDTMYTVNKYRQIISASETTLLVSSFQKPLTFSDTQLLIDNNFDSVPQNEPLTFNGSGQVIAGASGFFGGSGVVAGASVPLDIYTAAASGDYITFQLNDTTYYVEIKFVQGIVNGNTTIVSPIGIGSGFLKRNASDQVVVTYVDASLVTVTNPVFVDLTTNTLVVVQQPAKFVYNGLGRPTEPIQGENILLQAVRPFHVGNGGSPTLVVDLNYDSLINKNDVEVHGPVYTITDAPFQTIDRMYELQQVNRAFITIPNSGSVMIPNTTHKDLLAIRNAGFNAQRDSNDQITASRGRTTNAMVIADTVIIWGLEHVKVVDISTVYVGLPEGTPVGSYTIDVQGNIDIAAVPFSHDGTDYVMGTTSQFSSTTPPGQIVELPDDQSITPISIATFNAVWKPILSYIILVEVNGQYVLPLDFTNNAANTPSYDFPTTGIYTFTAKYRQGKGFVTLTVDFESTW